VYRASQFAISLCDKTLAENLMAQREDKRREQQAKLKLKVAGDR
jgi:hypothetical protein